MARWARSSVSLELVPGNVIKFIRTRTSYNSPSDFGIPSFDVFEPGQLGIVISVVNESTQNYTYEWTFIVASDGNVGWVITSAFTESIKIVIF